IPQLRESFGISLPSPSDLLLIFGLGLAVFVVMEAMKAALLAIRKQVVEK
ncbi:hypothetical protein LCGC14_2061390, partial [marine sediment metagenome]